VAIFIIKYYTYDLLKMKIIISGIPEEGLDVQLNEAIESENISSTVIAQLRIEKLETEVIVSGDLAAEVKLQCSRCLKDFSSKLTIPVNVVYHPVEELKGEDKYEVSHEELDMDFYSGDELDLSILLKEQLMLNIPMKPLCADLCKGICLVCGGDLNIEKCNCTITKTDPRFEGLKKLLK